MKKETKKRICEYEDWDNDKPCSRVASYECIQCGAGICRKHELDLMGECPYCEPPQLIKIK